MKLQDIIDKIFEGVAWIWDLQAHRPAGWQDVESYPPKGATPNPKASAEALQDAVDSYEAQRAGSEYRVRLRESATSHGKAIQTFYFSLAAPSAALGAVPAPQGQMPHQMLGLGYVPADVLDQRLAIERERNQIALERMKQELELGYKLKDIDRREKAIAEREAEVDNQQRPLQRALEGALGTLAETYFGGGESATLGGVDDEKPLGAQPDEAPLGTEPQQPAADPRAPFFSAVGQKLDVLIQNEADAQAFTALLQQFQAARSGQPQATA